MKEDNKLTINDELRMYVSQVKLAKSWWQTGFSVAFFCFIIFLWSIELLPGNFWFFNKDNMVFLKWGSIIIGIISLIFGIVIFKGYKYATSYLKEVVHSYEENKD